jgi:hypothetical protein
MKKRQIFLFLFSLATILKFNNSTKTTKALTPKNISKMIQKSHKPKKQFKHFLTQRSIHKLKEIGHLHKSNKKPKNYKLSKFKKKFEEGRFFTKT